MTPGTQLAYYALWVSQPVLQLGAAGVLVWRKLQKTFRVFLAYVLFQVVMSAVLLPISLKGPSFYLEYFFAYWIANAISLVLGFMVIHEIFVDIFRPYHTLKDLGTVLFKWAGLVMLLAACVVAAASTVSDQGPLVAAVLAVQRCVRVTQCGLVLFLLLFARYLGVSWKQQSFGIALGFGTFAGVELFCGALRASSYISEINSSFVIMGAYNCAILIWIGYMWVKQPRREMPSNLLTTQRWEETLTDLQHPVPADSLIPMFEGMVDRALSRARQENLRGVDFRPEPRPEGQSEKDTEKIRPETVPHEPAGRR